MANKNKVQKTGDFGPEQLAETLQKYKLGLKLPEEVNGATAAEDYEKSRKPDFYQSIKIDGKTVEEKFNASAKPDEITAIKNELKNALALTPDTVAAIATFKQNMTNLDQLCKNKPNGVSPFYVTDKIAAYKATFLTAMEKQQQQDVTRLGEVFRNKKEEIKAAFGVNTDPEVDAIKTQFIDALKKEQGDRNNPKENTQMKAFLMPVNTEQNKLFKSIEKDLARLNEKRTLLNYVDPTNSSLVNKFKRSALFSAKEFQILHPSTWTLTPFDAQAPGAMQEEMKNIIEENRKKEAENAQIPAQIRSGQLPEDDDRGHQLKDLEVNKLQNMQTTTGRKITKIADNHYQIQIPPLSAWDWWSPHNIADVTKDIQSLAERVKAEGHESIKFTLEHPDEDKAKELAGIALSEAMKAGFDESKITLVVNGKTLKGDELKSLLTPDALEEARKTQKLTKDTYKRVRTQHADQEEIKAGDDELKKIEAAGKAAPNQARP